MVAEGRNVGFRVNDRLADAISICRIEHVNVVRALCHRITPCRKQNRRSVEGAPISGLPIGGVCAPPMAERVGFEPTMRFRINAYQAPGLNRSPTVSCYLASSTRTCKAQRGVSHGAKVKNSDE